MFGKNWTKITWNYYEQSVNELAADDIALCIGLARGIGANQLMLKLNDNNFRKITNSKYNLNSEYNGKLVFELCLATMISVWFYTLNQQKNNTAEEQQKEKTAAFQLSQELLGINHSEHIHIYEGFDKQYQAYIDRTDAGLPAFYTNMLIYRYFECVSNNQFIKWQQINFPVDDIEPILNSYYPNAEGLIDLSKALDQVTYLWQSITIASKLMFMFFKQNYKSS